MPEFSNDAINEASIRMDECYSRLNQNEITWNEAFLNTLMTIKQSKMVES